MGEAKAQEEVVSGLRANGRYGGVSLWRRRRRG